MAWISRIALSMAWLNLREYAGSSVGMGSADVWLVECVMQFNLTPCSAVRLVRAVNRNMLASGVAHSTLQGGSEDTNMTDDIRAHKAGQRRIAKEEAYQAGYKAYGERKASSQNPYQAGDLHDLWYAGWRQADRDDGK